MKSEMKVYDENQEEEKENVVIGKHWMLRIYLIVSFMDL
jgi:hypothetical protein